MSSGRRLADQLDVIKSLASRTQTIHILIGTYELLPFRNLSGQLSRRSVDVHFSRYRAESEDDIRVFQNVVSTFQQQLPADQGFDLISVWDFLGLSERAAGALVETKPEKVRTPGLRNPKRHIVGRVQVAHA